MCCNATFCFYAQIAMNTWPKCSASATQTQFFFHSFEVSEMCCVVREVVTASLILAALSDIVTVP